MSKPNQIEARTLSAAVFGYFAVDKSYAVPPTVIQGMAASDNGHLSGDVISEGQVHAGLVAPGEWIVVALEKNMGETSFNNLGDSNYLTIDYTLGTELLDISRDFAIAMFRLHSSLNITKTVEGPSKIGRARLGDAAYVFFWLADVDRMLIIYDSAARDIAQMLVSEVRL